VRELKRLILCKDIGRIKSVGGLAALKIDGIQGFNGIDATDTGSILP